MVPQPFNTTELIAGYTITERIGAGGYGEVWKAEAPGGLAKAIKLVYGYLDDDRATREMKALERVKQVRHPFLLSLERIEIVDGRLVIVTELAEMSLMDRFTECQRTSLPGIPREELLVYLRDAADALDFMHERFGLQHLDVKPENLLLLGGRVKVADFGLVKDLAETNVSMVSGMTPVYAPPEVFDGQASAQSDQYSLAVLYQEMLTGLLPFPGRTASQLATQHLRSRPRLGPLPDHDRPIIERALAKQPEDRFENCGAMVDALRKAMERRQEKVHSGDELADADTASLSDHATEFVSRKSDPCSDSQATLRGLALAGDAEPDVRSTSGFADVEATDAIRLAPPSQPLPITTLPPVEAAAELFTLQPTLFVGVGGTAARTLQRLKLHFQDRYGDFDALPAMQMLLIDTDPDTIQEATGGAHGAALATNETLPIPLRQVHDYRAHSERFLQWLSRRWLYNIPRSLRTAGIRPLGRLAFVDHARRVAEQLRVSLATTLDSRSIAATRSAAGVDVNGESPRVVVVGSIGGGTGSGMLIDVAHAARNVLAVLGHADSEILGVLMHGTGRNPATKDLAAASAYAFLEELHHCRCFGSPAGGHPTFESSGATFDHAYLLHLGDDLQDSEYDEQVDLVADYLFRDSATASRTALGACRQMRRSADEKFGEVTLRSFALRRLGEPPSRMIEAATDLLCKTAVGQWLRSESLPASGLEQPAQGEPPAPSKGTKRRDPTERVSAILDATTRRAAQGRRGGIRDRVRKRLGNYSETRLATIVADFVVARFGLSDTNAAEASDSPDVLSRLDDRMEKLLRQLQQVHGQISRPAELIDAKTTGDDEDGFDPAAWVRQSIRRRMSELAAQLQDDFLQKQFSALLGPSAAPDGHIARTSSPERALWSELREAARAVIVNDLRHLDGLKPSETTVNGLPSVETWNDYVRDVSSPLLECGGARRLVLMLPQGPAAAGLAKLAAESWGEAPSVVHDSAGGGLLCCEIEQLPLARAAAHLVDYRADYVEAAWRLHTRIDVAWQPLCRLA
ncbi:MAG: tubulin-like doman-containing protein [Pirellulales bacterium]